jgi:hypothetical protein
MVAAAWAIYMQFLGMFSAIKVTRRIGKLEAPLTNAQGMSSRPQPMGKREDFVHCLPCHRPICRMPLHASVTESSSMESFCYNDSFDLCQFDANGYVLSPRE